MMEMTLDGCRRLMKEHLIAGGVSVFVGYSFGTIAPTGGRVRLDSATACFSAVKEQVSRLFEEVTVQGVPIRRLGISFDNVMDEGNEGYDLFTDRERLEKEKRAERAAMEIRQRMGKNALLRAMDLEKGATAIERNGMIGGHKA